MMSLAAFMHPRVRPAEPKPAPAPSGPPCGAVDWLSGSMCSRPAGHESGHASEDLDFEVRWPRA